MQATPANTQPVAAPQSSGIGPDDVLYTLFRHRQLILGSFILALIGVGIARVVYRPYWVTQAKVNVPFIKETIPTGPVDPEARAVFVDQNGQSIIGTEIEILKSFDVASNAAYVVTPERILPKNSKSKDLLSAASTISAGLEITPPQRASSLTIYYRHHDQSVAQSVLSAVIEAYKIQSFTVHNKQQFDDAAYQVKVVAMKKQIEAEEKELMETKKKLLVLSLDDTKKEYQARILKLSEQLSDAERELAERKAVMGDTTMKPGVPVTNGIANAPTPEIIEEYHTLLSQIRAQKDQEQQFVLKGYKEAHPMLLAVRGEIKRLTEERTRMIQRFPTLANVTLLSSTNSTAAGVLDLAEIQALTKRVEFYKDQLAKLQREASDLIEIEPVITSREAQLELDRTNYHAYAEALSRARNLSSFDVTKQVSITTIEQPTPPWKDTKKQKKLLGAIFGACLGLGLGLAFLIDFVLDRSIKRTVDIERHLRLPVFQCIPHTAWSGTFRLPWSNGGANGNGHGAHTMEGQESVSSLVHWDPKHLLHPYTEGLRERLMTYFEVNDAAKRPKLVGLTACAEGSGVTTLATGLAASLSKTGSGNVLFVDMHGADASWQGFFDGKATCGLNSALEPNGHSEAQVKEHLFAASGVGGGEGQLVKYESGRIAHLMPKIKQSDYDYIIFDLPPVSQTSATPRLSGYMDITLLVVESERTAQQAALKASALMREARANVATVLNKYRRRVPEALSHDL